MTRQIPCHLGPEIPRHLGPEIPRHLGLEIPRHPRQNKALSNDAVVLPKWLILIIGGVLMTSTAVFGFKALSMLSVIVLPLLLILLLVSLFKASADISVAEIFAKLPKEAMPLGVAVSIVTGAMVVGVSWMPDITRYSRSKRQAAFGMVLGMMIGSPLFIILAAYLGSVSGTPNFVEVMLKFNVGLWALFALFVVITSTWTTNDNNLYSAGLAFNAIVPKWPKWVLTTVGGLLGGALGTIAALLGILGQFTNWMIALGVMITPMAAVMIVDFFLFKSHIYKYSTLDSAPLYRHRAYISWTLGVIVGFLTYFGVFTLTHAPALDAIIVAGVAHLVIMLVTEKKFQVNESAM